MTELISTVFLWKKMQIRSPSLVLRNWLLLYFSVKTKSSVRYNFLNILIVFAVRCSLVLTWRVETRLFTRTARIESASLYVISAMTPATMCRSSATLYAAGCVVECSGTDISHFKLFYFPNIIGLVQRTFLACIIHTHTHTHTHTHIY